MLRLFCLSILLASAGCASNHELALCKGSLTPLNPTHWQPTPVEMASLEKACPEDQ